MEVYQPLQIAEGDDKGRWRMTYSNSGGTYTKECCRPDGKLHSHATSDEAYNCYLDHKAKSMKVYKQDDKQERCKVCNEFTQNLCSDRGPLPSFVPLCDKHATPENFRKHLR